MILLLSFLLAWLCGMLILLAAAFLLYEQFSIIDITSFAVFTFAGSLIVIFIIYRLSLHFFYRKIKRNQFLFIPAALATAANLPVYFFIWLKTGDLYGRSEAFLFTLFFITVAFAFGLCMAWKNRAPGKEL